MKIRIQTAQNVEIEYEIAGIGYRFLAALVDLAIFVGYYALIYIVAGMIGFGTDFPEWMIWIFIIPPVPLLLYPLLCEIFLRGQTIGKRALNLKVVRVDGGEPSIGSYILRWLFWLLEANPLTAIAGLGAASIISIFSTRLGQRIGDIAAGTTVVRLPREEQEERGIAERIRISPDYEPLIPEVVRLTPADIDIISRGWDAIDRGADDQIGTRLAYRVAEVLGIENHRVGETTRFLLRVLTDYAFLNRSETALADESGVDPGETPDAEPNEPFRPIY